MRDTLAPVRRQGLADRLARQVRELIRTGGYATGDRLPSIMEMARRFRVGHPTVREALRKLETLGVVEIRHGSGVYVSRSDDVLVMASPAFTGAPTRKLLLDLVEARIPIEVQSAASAARHASDEDLREMRRLLALAEESMADDLALNVVNMTFHRQIALASGNTVLAQLLDVIRELFAEEQRLILAIFGSRERDHREHLALLQALEARDEALAAQRMRVHLEGVREVLLRWDPERHPVGGREL